MKRFTTFFRDNPVGVLLVALPFVIPGELVQLASIASRVQIALCMAPLLVIISPLIGNRLALVSMMVNPTDWKGSNNWKFTYSGISILLDTGIGKTCIRY
jgi:hypothetical protein